MKIMICISQLTKGGAERVVSNLSNYLINKHKVVLVSLKNTEVEYKIHENVKIIKLDSKTSTNKLTKFTKRIRKLNQTLKKEKPDIVLCFLPQPSFLVLFLKKIRNLKVIVSVRNDPKIEYKKLPYKLAMKILYPKANGFIFQTKEAQEYFPKKIQNKSTIIFNSLNPDFLIDRFKGVRDKEIVSVGRLAEQKNQELLIKAFAKFHQIHPEYELTIYGEGPLKEKLQNLVKDLNMEEFIKLPGIENDIKTKIYKASFFVLSSDYEGMPNSLMEALTLGLPCISTDCPCGGPKTLIEDGINGILTEVGNIDMLTEKMNMIIEHPELKDTLSKNAQKNIEKMHPEKINKQWEEYLESINALSIE